MEVNLILREESIISLLELKENSKLG